MEEIIAAVVGIGIVAAAPFVPGLRPAAKKVIMSGMAIGASVATTAAVAGEHWADLVAEARAEREAEAAAKVAAESETITIPSA